MVTAENCMSYVLHLPGHHGQLSFDNLSTCPSNLNVFYVKLGHVKYLHVIPDIVIANCMSWLLLEAGQEEGGTSITPPPPATTILPPLVIWFTSGKDPPYLQLIFFNY